MHGMCLPKFLYRNCFYFLGVGGAKRVGGLGKEMAQGLRKCCVEIIYNIILY